jgi:CelD/BcsL family acetyltransferase involved in cellulose biosynthesis
MAGAALQHGVVMTAEASRVESAVAYRARCIVGASAILDRVAELEGASSTALAFQRKDWLKPLYQSLAVSLDAVPSAVEVTDSASGELVLLLPLVQTKVHGLRTLSFASLGVSDYGAPILGPAAPDSAAGAEALITSIRAAPMDADILSLNNMPAMVDGRVNPLTLCTSATPSRHARHVLACDGTVEALLASRGKKYRKESERCFRLLAEKGLPHFKRADSETELSRAYAILQAQQHSRRADEGDAYLLDRPAYSGFYHNALIEGAAAGTAHIFTLKAGDEVGAVLFGISHAGVFTLLRISTAQDEGWKRMSPGRLIVIETMRHFIDQGVRTFDMGIGSYSFKHGFGIAGEPLYDLTLPLSAKALPRVALDRAKSKLRQHPRLMAAAKRLMGRE